MTVKSDVSDAHVATQTFSFHLPVNDLLDLIQDFGPETDLVTH